MPVPRLGLIAEILINLYAVIVVVREGILELRERHVQIRLDEFVG